MSKIYEILSPLPGTFYQKESPTAAPFVLVGQEIKAGDVVGLVEVMKMFNQITSEHAGIVIEVCVENDEPVDVGEVLFRIEVSA
ncbi:acetyl-CoA carboxylase [Hydromonas duriensis]|uniref:Biotin carboxyl carrier protein of acetyl-CoA carboxylase n=1 Tax=Hydromonas duriensis TaxID=1527608 RepID=A0A4V3DK12_9BURK|nr:acetyl-CoA carboxylase [Hydromonas duriensis]TDR31850.1 biotin carboxyl carrier protein [Hydromonas duriensis]